MPEDSPEVVAEQAKPKRGRPPTKKPLLHGMTARQYLARRGKEGPEANLESFEGVVETIKNVCKDERTPARERLVALKTLCDIRGFKQPKDYSDLRRLSTSEILDAIQTIVIPALYPFGVRDQYEPGRGEAPDAQP